MGKKHDAFIKRIDGVRSELKTVAEERMADLPKQCHGSVRETVEALDTAFLVVKALDDDDCVDKSNRELAAAVVNAALMTNSLCKLMNIIEEA